MSEETTQPPETEPSTNDLQTVSADELTSMIAPEMPDVTSKTDNTPEFRLESSTEPSPDKSELRDDDGILFNKKYHQTDSNGQPFKRRGKWVRISRGRMSKEEAEALRSTKIENTDPTPKSVIDGLTENAQPAQPTQPEKSASEKRAEKQAQLRSNYEVTAEMYLGIVDGVLDGLFGQDARLDGDDRTMLKPPLVAVMEEKGEIPLSPTQLLMAVSLSVAAKKASKPTVRERFVLLVYRIKNIFKKKGANND